MKTVWVVRIGLDVFVYEAELSARRKFDKDRRWWKDCACFEAALS